MIRIFLVTSLGLVSTTENETEADLDLFEGDIILPPLKDVVENSLGLDYRWSEGVVPYRIGEGVTQGEETNILQAMAGITELVGSSCIKFVPVNDTSQPFLSVWNRYFCNAALGSSFFSLSKFLSNCFR